MTEFRYRAFISYNHADESWARWLHRALETYRVPGKLSGQVSEFGPIPKRLQPVFRDRDELGSSADLSGRVKEALADSEALIVICSPQAVASRWVNEEIREFRRLDRGHRIFAMIVGGDPQAHGGEACFPEALTEGLDGGRTEPLAADARKWADGRRLAKLKLLAGILGIPLDSLRRRDLQRRQRNWILTTVAMVALVLVLALAVTSRIAAEKRRALAQELVSFKMNDLGGRLELPEGFDILARLGEWSDDQRNEALDLSRESAIESALGLRSDGLNMRRGGDASGALERFRESWKLLAAHYAQRPGDHELLFELGQAEFWIGQVLVEQRRFEQAEESMAVYADISRRLLRAEPENADAVLEMAYALTNIGYLEILREGARPERALQYMQGALEFNQIALVLDPGNELYRTELEQSHANIADAQLQVCDLGGALHSRMESTRLAREFFLESPRDERTKRLLAYSLGGLARVQFNIGLADQALANLEESRRLLTELVSEYPENDRYQDLRLTRGSRMLDVLARQDRVDNALARLQELQAEWDNHLATHPELDARSQVNYVEFLLTRATIESRTGAEDAARASLGEALSEILDVLEASPDLAIGRTQLAMAAYRYWEMTGDLPQEGVLARLPGTENPDTFRKSCLDVNVAARLAVMRGDLAAAQSYTSYLLSKGYFEPGFIRFCRSRGVCEQ